MARINNKYGTKKEAIIEAAAKLFYAQGFPATTMRDLAINVGVEAASLYNHIRSKSEILEKICFAVAHSFMNRMEEIDKSDQNSIHKLESLLRLHIRQMIDNHEYVHVSDREWRHLDEPYLSSYQDQRRVYRRRFAAIIEKGIATQEIRDVDAPTAVLIMLHAISGIESWHRSKKRISGELLEDNMVMILIEGMKEKKECDK
ncbi:MAG: TetR/AcrR family transcriptional regulator [Chitinophagaceae bacterium]